MRTIFTLVILVCSSIISVAQLTTCRPRICLLDYNFHNDNMANADMASIKTAKPDILIDNTPGGYWNGGCKATEYTPLGIQVYSYITGGYEGTKYHTTEDALASNLARIDAIALDGASGVFLDEVSGFPDSAAKVYLTAIYNRCQAKGLKLIFNPGQNSFAPWLMTKCDLLMSDEHYTGKRAPSTYEAPFASRLLVVSEGITSAAQADSLSLGARDNGFGYSYGCTQYISLPSWLPMYMTGIVQKPSTPAITAIAGTLHSSAASGNQWYKTPQVIIPSATGQTYTPTSAGTYYTIVTLDGCTSDTSNMMTISSTGVASTAPGGDILFYPNPSSGKIMVNTVGNNATTFTLAIFDTRGAEVFAQSIPSGQTNVDLGQLANGVYLMKLRGNGIMKNERFLIQR